MTHTTSSAHRPSRGRLAVLLAAAVAAIQVIGFAQQKPSTTLTQLADLADEEDHLEQEIDVGLLTGGHLDRHGLAAPFLADEAVLLQLLAVQGLLAAVGETARPILFAGGKPRLYAALKAAHVFVFVAMAVPLTLGQQAFGAAVATAITAAIFAPVSLYAAWRVTRYNVAKARAPREIRDVG